MATEEITATEAAKRLGVSQETIRRATLKGRIHRGENKLYLWPQVKSDFEQTRSFRNDETTSRNPTTPHNHNPTHVLSFTEEQRLLVKARREKVEFETKVKRGEYLKKTDVQKAIRQTATQLKTEFQNFPVRLAPAMSAAIIGLGPNAKAEEIETTVRKVWEDEAYKSLDQILAGEILQ